MRSAQADPHEPGNSVALSTRCSGWPGILLNQNQLWLASAFCSSVDECKHPRLANKHLQHVSIGALPFKRRRLRWLESKDIGIRSGPLHRASWGRDLGAHEPTGGEPCAPELHGIPSTSPQHDFARDPETEGLWGQIGNMRALPRGELDAVEAPRGRNNVVAACLAAARVTARDLHRYQEPRRITVPTQSPGDMGWIGDTPRKRERRKLARLSVNKERGLYAIEGRPVHVPHQHGHLSTIPRQEGWTQWMQPPRPFRPREAREWGAQR
jgi:hypothetical protein